MERTDLRYKVVAIDVDGGQHQSGHEDHQAKGEAAEASWKWLLGSDGKNQLLL